MRVLVIDSDRCTGCRSCAVACSAWNTGEVNLNNSCIRIIPFENVIFYFQSVCQQCDNPNCSLVCPVSAISRNPNTNAMEVNKDICIGCKLCLLSCPLGAINIVEGKSHKCNLCEGDPKCVASCDYGALRFGEVDEIGLNKRNKIAEVIKDIVLNVPATHTIKIGTIGTKAGVINAKDLGLKEINND